MTVEQSLLGYRDAGSLEWRMRQDLLGYRQCNLSAIPGLLQSEEYARAAIGQLAGLEAWPPAEIERRLHQRMVVRPELLRLSGVTAEFFVGEAALRQQVGDLPTTLSGVLAVRAAITSADNMTVRMLPFDNPGLAFCDSFVVTETPVDTLVHIFDGQEPRESHTYAGQTALRLLQHYEEAALSPEASLQLVDRCIRELGQQ
jgi:hypothetical protein